MGAARAGNFEALRVGVEIETIPVHARTGARVPPRSSSGPSSVGVLEALARRHGWQPFLSPSGAPAYRLPAGGHWSFEPGGQLEYSSPPHASVDALLKDVEKAFGSVAHEARRHDVRLLGRGVDPHNAPGAAALVLDGDRYQRMAAHFDRLGPAGRGMMCQTAAVQVNVDPADGAVAWAVANAMAPAVLATFANSPRYAGAATGLRSWRAEQWRRLDPLRTGVFADAPGAVEAYLDFALDAPAFLLGDAREARPFRDWLGEGVALEDFARHLTTLFPEVRPRGYLELRSYDALPLRFLPAALVVAVGVLQDPVGLEAAREALPLPSAEALVTAGRTGLGHADLRIQAVELFRIALQGAERLGTRVVGGGTLASARAFFDELTSRGRDPGDLPSDDLL
jgi:glutamate--cysteine ligase